MTKPMGRLAPATRLNRPAWENAPPRITATDVARYGSYQAARDALQKGA